jgi:transcription-repair coupling factor (superfamily II helicase)
MSAHDGKICALRDAVALLSDTVGMGGGKRPVVSGLCGSSKAYMLSLAFISSGRRILAITPDIESAEDLADDLGFFLPKDQVALYPPTETLPFEPEAVHQEILASRTGLLYRLTEDRPLVVVSAVEGLMQRVMPAAPLAASVINLKAGQEHQRDALIESLVELGYARMSVVEERGELSVRGGILDIFPPLHDAPLRIEFFGDEMESIRAFDISTQRSLRELSEALILPARLLSLGRRARLDARERLMEAADSLGLERAAWEGLSERLRDGRSLAGMDHLLPLFYPTLSTVFDYLGEGAATVIVEPGLVSAAAKRFEEAVAASAERLRARGRLFVEPGRLYLDGEELCDLASRGAVIEISALGGEVEVASESNFALRQDMSLSRDEPLKPLIEAVNGWIEDGFRVCITAHNRGQAERTKEILEGRGLTPAISSGTDLPIGGAAGLTVAIGSLKGGFRLADESLVIVTEEEVFGEKVKRRAPPAKKLDAFLAQLNDLSEGDPIVHADHGIGMYRGLKRLDVEGVANDFLLIEYRGGDRLYLPVWRMDLVSKYRGGGASPELDRLGGAGWGRTKKRVKHSVEKLAGELLKLYAERRAAEGFAFPRGGHLFEEFEAGFEYDETPDQARAIEECVRDMEGPRPMDRLVCGDVGYGKTEVAIRAAFKAVLGSKQVAVLVPTTVLAQQHYLTFSKRLAPYPAVVEVLSRFKSPKEQRETLKRVKSGAADIIIGTHRLLQNDVEFRDLGLLVIDEEHRFGVAHKERLKRLRKKVDVLTLTATPIPRTLNMSLAGIRELSVINTPPEDRLAVKTNIIRFDPSLIAEAIEREMKRGGQVFFVHNRVQSMGAMEEFLRKTAPGARIAVAHGQMNEAELEKKMLGFVAGGYDILLSTAIIESGLDIPAANTIIINRADRFGLAELHQLRGRVGRSRHRAYAYFITPDESLLTDDARKRMEVIRELCEPGSGFRIATYDLEIRGAGELLGASQWGRIAEVGFDMYSALLEEAVREIKGEEVREDPAPEINLRVSQYIPEEYMPEARERLGMYKRLSSVESFDELSSMKDELEDRWGPLPALVENLMRTIELKLLLKEIKARELTEKGARLYITFGAADEAVAARAVDMASKRPDRFRITPEGRLIAVMPKGASPVEEARYILKGLADGCYS